MSKILGIDLGTSSIGWAIINDNEIENSGVKLIPTPIRNQKRNLSTQNHLANTLTFAKNNIKTIALILITVAMFLLGLLYPLNWQFWINIGIGCLVATLTFSKK